jgi:hypothetical protein
MTLAHVVMGLFAFYAIAVFIGAVFAARAPIIEEIEPPKETENGD